MPLHLTCSQCETPIVRYRSHVRPKNFCSKACEGNALRGKALPNASRSPIELDDDGITARLVRRGRDGAIRAYALIDAADASWIGQYRWTLHGDRDGYVRRSAAAGEGWRYIFLHREKLGLAPGDGIDVDHINRNKLDNRGENLRKVTHAQNCQNTPSHGGYSSFRGVSWHNQARKWIASITINSRSQFLGLFDSETDAADAALAARQRLMPYAID